MHENLIVARGKDDGAGNFGGIWTKFHVAFVQKLVKTSADEGLKEGEFIGVVIVKGGAIHGSGFSDVLN